MFSYEDIFQPETKESLEIKQKISQEASLAVKAVGDTARSCINTEAFSAYKLAFSKAEAKIVDAMISYTHNFFQENNGDMAIYGANMARFITKIQDLKALLNAVETDAQKGENSAKS